MTDIKTAVITGAGSGIGRACAQRLANDGINVVLVDKSQEGLDETFKLLDARRVMNVFAIDITQEHSFELILEDLRDLPLDIAVNAAGIEGVIAHSDEIEPSDLRQVLEVNVVGLSMCMRAEIERMKHRKRGAIVNVGSIYGINGQARFGAYSATKHAVAGLTKAAALENAHIGIRVNAVAPGPIATPLLDRSTGGDPNRVVGNIPMRRLGTSGEVAAAVAWLASDDASFVTGHILSVDGGMIAQSSNTGAPIPNNS